MSLSLGSFERLRPYAEARAESERAAGSGARAADRSPVAVAPRSVGEILDGGFEILREHFFVLVGVCALLWLPVRVSQAMFGPHVFARVMAREDTAPGAILGAFTAFAAGQAAVAAVHVLATAYVTAFVAAHARSGVSGAGAALRAVFRRAPGLLLLVLLTAIVASMGFLACLAPGVYLSFKLSVAPSAYVVEEGSIGESVNRSMLLTRGSFLRWLAVWVVAWMLAIPFSSLAAIGDNAEFRPYALEFLSLSERAFDAWFVPLTSLANAMSTAIMSVAMTAFYFDCRARKDGDDLYAELARIAPSPARGRALAAAGGRAHAPFDRSAHAPFDGAAHAPFDRGADAPTRHRASTPETRA